MRSWQRAGLLISKHLGLSKRLRKSHSTQLDNRALPLTRGQLDIWLTQENGSLRYRVAAWPLRGNRGRSRS